MKQSSFSKFIFDHYAKSYFLVPKSVSRFSKHVQELHRKDIFNPLCFVFKNYDQVSKGDSGPPSNCQIRHFCSIRIKIGPKSHIQAVYQSRDLKVYENVILVQLLLLEWLKSAVSNTLKMNQNRHLTRDHNFRRKTIVYQKRLFEAIFTCDLNSFRHFSGPGNKKLRS